MEKSEFQRRIFLGLSVCVVLWCSSCARGSTRIPENCKWIEVEDEAFRSRVEALAAAVDFNSWPQSDFLKVSPRIGKSLLVEPNLVTSEYFTCNEIRFIEGDWIQCWWKWRRVIERPKPLPIPTELPAARKEKWLAHLSPKLRNDPNFVESYLAQKLERERKSKKYRFSITGLMELQVCVAPCSRAAQEYLVSYMPLRSNMGDRAIAQRFSESKRWEGLGTIGFVSPPMVMFTRDNIAVIIDARGKLAGEAVPLALKIDSLIKKQPALTYEQLLARKPSITIAKRAEKTEVTAQKTVSYEVSVPKGQEIVSVRAYVDGRQTGVKDGKVYIVGKKEGKVKVKLTTTTSELVSNAVEQEVIIGE